MRERIKYKQITKEIRGQLPVITPAPKGTLVNGVGAGDSMVAGFMAGWMEKQDYEYAFHMGVAAGSASAFSENLATKEESDMVVFGFCYVRAHGETGKAVIPHTEKTTFSGKEVQNVFLADLIGPDVKNGKQTVLWMSACACLYSLEMIQKASWRFVSEREIISEDVYSLLNLY